ncbi:uncharacterized protein LOC110644422 [Hevea brasiliensis]|uniref:uncharacterized protein LOC110644422 n=1 Tax=Hevea brasiliensis TaxID=3981 RepID=UPI0025D45AE2|nr:uncharacterized protein LOC110644422 [Hevea brasiliensis]
MVRRKRQLPNNAEECVEDWDDSASSNSKRVEVESGLGEAEDNECYSTSCSYFSKVRHQYKVSGMADSVVNEKLALFILSNNIAFDIVEAPFFVDFVRGVAECGISYKLPSSLMLQRNAFLEVEMEVEKYVTKVRHSWTMQGCTIMIGMWNNFISITAYSAEGAEFLKFQEISKLDVKDIVSSVIDDIGEDHVVQVITNSDTIYYSIENLLLNKYSHICQIRCVAHEIHSLMKAIYSEVGWIQETIDHAALVVKCMYEDDIFSKLKYPCESKFASNYQMLLSILGNKNELRQLECGRWKLLEQNRKKIKNTNIIESGKFWSQVQEVLNVMEPLIQVLRLVEDDRPTLGYLYEAMEKAKETIERQYSNDCTKYEKIRDLFQEWRSKKIIHPIHAAAAFLNPSYMCRDGFELNSEMKTGIKFIFSTMVASQDKDKFVEEVKLYEQKMPLMFNTLAYDLLQVSHPCAWWDATGVCLPVLKKYAIRLLSQPCKCSCDLKPSAFEVARRKMMNGAIKTASHDNFVYTIMNAKIMEIFRPWEEQCMTPIDLENCNELPDYIDPQQSWWDDHIDETDNFHLDGKPRDCLKARKRWRKTFIVICTSNYLGLHSKIWSKPDLVEPLIDTDNMIKKAQTRWTKILSVVKWFSIYLEARKR